jgi:hypothetical protein
MTTEKKVVSKAASTAVAKSKAVSKPTRQSPARRTTASKTVVKPVVDKAISNVDKMSPIKTTTVKKTGIENKLKPNKMKMARDSFTMPKDEYAQLANLKNRLAELGQPAKKSELLRAGIQLLVAMTDVRLKAAMAVIPVIKTGRPKKKK